MIHKNCCLHVIIIIVFQIACISFEKNNNACYAYAEQLIISNTPQKIYYCNAFSTILHHNQQKKYFETNLYEYKKDIQNYNYDSENTKHPCSSKNYININFPYNNQKPHLDYHQNNNIHHNFKIQVQNNSINFSHMLHDAYPKNLMYNQKLYFFQFGMQNVLSENTFNLGIGEKNICKNTYVIGYNILFNIPIFNQIQQPYSLNIGGEYWYKNLFFLLNGYYNLNKVIYFNQSSLCTDPCLYPQIGYQIQLQIQLPYILKCANQIKWEQFYYNNDNNTLINELKERLNTLSIGIKYQPVPMLELCIDNIFVNKKYNNTVFKISLLYQFNVPINLQLQQKYQHNMLQKQQMFFPNDLNIAMESFTPKLSNILFNSDLNNFDIINKNSKNNTSITTDTHKKIKYRSKSKNDHSNYGMHIKDDSDIITHIFKKPIFIEENNDPSSSHIESNNFQTENKENHVDSDIMISHLFTNHNDLCINDDNIENSTVINLKNQNETISQDQDIINVSTIDNTNSTPLTKITNNISSDQNNDDNNKNIKNSMQQNIPPTPPKLPDFVCVNNNTKSKIQVSDNNTQSPLCKIESHTSQNSNTSIMAGTSTSSEINPDIINTKIKSKSNTNLSLDKNIDFSHQLFMQKNKKFSSVGTKEYLNNLETSILNRKKEKKVTDIEKMFNKLHATLSQSSIAESTETNDSTDSFE